MNKYDFLSRLRSALSPLPREERDAAMNYYEEFFSDAGEDNEQAVIASLGSPEELAKSIVDENSRDNPASSNSGSVSSSAPAEGFNNQTVGSNNSASGFNPPPTPAQKASGWTGGQIALFVVLAVLSAPIWLGLLCAVFGVIVCLFAAVVGIIAAFGACSVAFFVSGLIALFHEPLIGVMLLGFSLIFAGLFPLLIFPMCKGVVMLSKTCIKGIGELINKITGKREAV